MNVSICAIAKNEHVYINDWINYHLNLGFDKIYVYDNNKANEVSLDSVIVDKENVVVTPFETNGVFFDTQAEAYNHFIDNYGQEYDWCLFIDIDEFVHLNVDNVKTFLAKAPDTDHNILLHWNLFGDDGVIVGDESVPIYERILKPIKSAQSVVYNSFVNFKTNPTYKACSPHLFAAELMEKPLCYDCNFNEIRYYINLLKASFIDLDKYECYINHYQTRTLSEFIKYKYENTKVNYDYTDEMVLDAFFANNEKTPEKLKYIKDTLNIDYK